VDGGGFHDGGHGIALAQLKFGGGLRGDEGDQWESAIEFDAGERAFERDGADAGGNAIAHRRWGSGVAGDSDILGVNADKHRPGLTGIDALQARRSDLEREESRFPRGDFGGENIFDAE
jgi:hypothetical protein